MKNGSSDSHLIFADTMIFAIILWTYFCDVQSHGGLVSGKNVEIISSEKVCRNGKFAK